MWGQFLCVMSAIVSRCVSTPSQLKLTRPLFTCFCDCYNVPFSFSAAWGEDEGDEGEDEDVDDAFVSCLPILSPCLARISSTHRSLCLS